MNLQCTLKFLKYGLPALRLEFMVLSRFIMYNRVFIRRLYANRYVSFRPKFWSAGSLFYLKILEKYSASRCEFGADIKSRPPTWPIYLSHTEMMNIKGIIK